LEEIETFDRGMNKENGYKIVINNKKMNNIGLV
jgi:hypothetical protein